MIYEPALPKSYLYLRVYDRYVTTVVSVSDSPPRQRGVTDG